MSWRGRLVAGGLAAFAVALLVTFVPGGEAVVPVEPVVGVLGGDYLLVAVVGVLAVVAVLVLATRRASSRVDQATPPDPEGVQGAPPLGAAFDRRLEEPFELRSLVAGRPRSAVRERLREAATLAVARQDGATREAARRTVEAGQWTDDPVAAMFLRRRPPAPSLDRRIHSALRGDTWFQYAARETAVAIASEAGVEPEPDPVDRYDQEGGPSIRRWDDLRPDSDGGRHV